MSSSVKGAKDLTSGAQRCNSPSWDDRRSSEARLPQITSLPQEGLMVEAGITRRRRFAGMVLIAVVVLALVGAATAKFLGVAAITTQLTSFGFSRGWIIALGVIELASAVLLAIPRTRALGLLLITGFLGGAIATHIQHGQSPAQPAVLLALGWTGIWLRHPLANWSHLSIASRLPDHVAMAAAQSQPNEAPHTKAALWFSRIILALVAAILLLISEKYLFDTTAQSAARGIVLTSGLGMTIARVGFGAFPLACAIVVIASIASAKRVRLGLWFVLTLFGTVLIVRLAGAIVDKSLSASVSLMIPEVVFLVLTSLALWVGRRATRPATRDETLHHARVARAGA
jgi:hypothetical protein